MDGERKNIPMEEKEMSFVETMEYIDSLRAYGVVPGLDNMRRLCARLENPQDDLKFVHIAGTNGKGSVLCFLSAVLAQEGYRVGSYSSPAVADYRDTIQTGGRMISRARPVGLSWRRGIPTPPCSRRRQPLPFYILRKRNAISWFSRREWAGSWMPPIL